MGSNPHAFVQPTPGLHVIVKMGCNLLPQPKNEQEVAELEDHALRRVLPLTPEKKFKQFDDSLKINRHTKLSSSFFQVFFSTPNSLMIVLVTPNYHQLLLDTENYRKTIIK